jgi:hypothetical protein
MTIPVESSEVERFTPSSLIEPMGDSAPVFLLRSPTERDLRRYNQLVGYDGLRWPSDDELNAAKLDAIKPPFWDDKTAQDYRATFTTLEEKKRQEIALTDGEQQWLDELDAELTKISRPLNIIIQDRRDFLSITPLYSIAVYCRGWEGLVTEFRLEAGAIPMKTVRAMIRELKRMAQPHLPELADLPLIELYGACTNRLRLDEEEEKNLPAPSLNSANQDASTSATPAAGEFSEESPAEKITSSSSKPKTAPAAG